MTAVVEFYLDANSTWDYWKLIEHLRTLLEMGETFGSLVRDLYSKTQHLKEIEDQFIDELQILSRKVLSVHLEWKVKVNKDLKTQFAFQLHDPYLSAMVGIYLKRKEIQ